MDDTGYKYSHADLNSSHEYLLPGVLKIVAGVCPVPNRIFEIGCGNGSVANVLQSKGYQVIGVDSSLEGIALAREKYPHLQLELGSAYDDLHGKFGTFPLVLSLEVIEHLYFPRKFATSVFSLLEPGGTAIISTPYHGYVKNLCLALAGGMDKHFTALWDHGHIKFWSKRTLTILLEEAGFKRIRYVYLGRGVSFLAKSFIAIAEKP